MTEKMKNEIENLTNSVVKARKNKKSEEIELVNTEKANKFRSIITNHIIPVIKDSSMIIGRSGCSLNYYSNELAIIRDPNKRIFIQILFYPYGHSKITLGVNAPFLQFAFSPAKDNIKITTKLSIKSDEPRAIIDEIEIDEFTKDTIDGYILDFLKNEMEDVGF